jgi:hypothetical protein
MFIPIIKNSNYFAAMIKIEYPEPAFRLRGSTGREEIFDTIRGVWVRLTPEEWVRQNFIRWLTVVRRYPVARIAVEKEIRLGELKKRFDILVYDSGFKPWMMVECKSPSVRLDEKVLMQLLRYNMALPVSCLVFTNGTYCFAASLAGNNPEWLEYIPELP